MGTYWGRKDINHHGIFKVRCNWTFKFFFQSKKASESNKLLGNKNDIPPCQILKAQVPWAPSFGPKIWVLNLKCAYDLSINTNPKIFQWFPLEDHHRVLTICFVLLHFFFAQLFITESQPLFLLWSLTKDKMMKDPQANIHLTVCSKLWSLLQEDCDDKLRVCTPCKQSWSSKMTSVGEERNWKQIEGTQTWWPFPVFLLLATVQEEAWESTTTSRAGASPGESSTESPGHVIREPPREATPCLPSPLEMVWKRREEALLGAEGLEFN